MSLLLACDIVLHHMLRGSVLLWCHQVTRFKVELHSRFVWRHQPSNDIMGPICSGYVFLLLRGGNCELSLQLDFFRWRLNTTNIFWKIHVAHAWRSKLLCAQNSWHTLNKTRVCWSQLLWSKHSNSEVAGPGYICLVFDWLLWSLRDPPLSIQCIDVNKWQ